MDRPALKRLLEDVEAGKVDCILVYKVDRLSRSLLDFSRIMETIEKHRASFVSATQQFNTNTSMGRLMLNVLLSFAQFEREMIAERTRDKMSAARRKGKWIGGMPVLGYDVDPQKSRLVVNEAEAERVREIFHLYLKHQSMISTASDLNRPNGIKALGKAVSFGRTHKEGHEAGATGAAHRSPPTCECSMGPYWIIPPSTPLSSTASLARRPSLSLRSSHCRRFGPASFASSDQSLRHRQKRFFLSSLRSMIFMPRLLLPGIPEEQRNSLTQSGVRGI